MRSRIILNNPAGSDEINPGLGPINIPAGTTVTVDTLILSDFISANYQVKLYNTANDKFSGFTMDVNRVSTDADFALYMIMGDNISRSVDVSISGSSVLFKITNNEAYDLTFDAFKFIS